jgi:hypothetical protein
MPPDTIHVHEDAFHRLQTSRPAVLTDEDLENAAGVAIWNCAPALRHRVHVAARSGVVTLTGTVASNRQRAAVVRAVRALDRDIRQVIDELRVAPETHVEDLAGPAPYARHEFAGDPMLYVTRYCSTEPSSITAALNDAARTLDQRFAALGLEPPDAVVVVYRNRLPESLTIDVGYVLPAGLPLAPEAELQAGRTPGGVMLSAPAPRGMRDLLGTHDRLIEEAGRQGLAPGNFAWQRFPYSAIRIQPMHRPGPLYIPVS